MNKRTQYAAAVFLVALAACGGGGGSDGATPSKDQSNQSGNQGNSSSNLQITGTSLSPKLPRARYAVQFTPGGNFPTGTTFSWDFGDGSALARELTPSHTYSAATSYTVKVTATSPDGNSASYTQKVTVKENQPPVLRPSIATNGPPVVSKPTTLSVTASDPEDDALTYTWRIDSQLVAEHTPDSKFIHTFNSTGVHAIVVTASDSYGGSVTQDYVVPVESDSSPAPTPTPPAWKQVSSGPPMSRVRIFADNTGWALSNTQAEALHTTDGGTTWETVTLPKSELSKTNGYLGVAFPSKDNGWMVGCPSDNYTETEAGFVINFNYGRAIHSVDGGKTWENVYLPSSSDDSGRCFMDIHFVGQNGWIVGQWGSVIATTDGGRNWKLLSSAGFNASRVYFTDSLHGWISGPGMSNGAAKVARTVDGGQTWTTSDLPVKSQVSGTQSLWFVSEKVGYVSGRTADAIPYPIFKTSDGGITWNAESLKDGFDVADIIFTDASTGYILDAWGSIYKTTNGGQRWQLALNRSKYEGYLGLVSLALGPQNTAWAVSSVIGSGPDYKKSGALYKLSLPN